MKPSKRLPEHLTPIRFITLPVTIIHSAVAGSFLLVQTYGSFPYCPIASSAQWSTLAEHRLERSTADGLACYGQCVIVCYGANLTLRLAAGAVVLSVLGFLATLCCPTRFRIGVTRSLLGLPSRLSSSSQTCLAVFRTRSCAASVLGAKRRKGNPGPWGAEAFLSFTVRGPSAAAAAAAPVARGRSSRNGSSHAGCKLSVVLMPR